MENLTKEKLTKLVLDLLKTHFEENGDHVDLSESEKTKLFGGDGILDSLGLVSFIVTVEEALQDELGITLVLADEKAMSRRTSPFAKVSYLVDYIFEVIQEN
jgi:D-alanine--poly(phosphoribitol) ligase subunit 2